MITGRLNYRTPTLTVSLYFRCYVFLPLANGVRRLYSLKCVLFIYYMIVMQLLCDCDVTATAITKPVNHIDVVIMSYILLTSILYAIQVDWLQSRAASQKNEHILFLFAVKSQSQS